MWKSLLAYPFVENHPIKQLILHYTHRQIIIQLFCPNLDEVFLLFYDKLYLVILYIKKETIPIKIFTETINYIGYFLMRSESTHRKSRSKSHLFDFQNGLALVTFLNRIPNLQKIHFRLSEQEEGVVGENHNLVVIGRSGTGKTTCALMRLFAIEIFFKNSLVKSIFSGENKSYRFKSEDLERTTGLKNIFLTASPFLITEIKSKYNELKLHVKVELEAKQVENQLLRQQGQTNAQGKGGVKDAKVKYGLDVIEKVEKDLRDRQNKFTSFSSLTPTDYPGFFSIKEFLIMLDGCLLHSFFIRKEDRSIMQESGGGLRKRSKYAAFRVRLGSMEYWGMQSNWNIFSQQFWKTISWKEILKRYNYKRDAYKEVTAIAVWTEIVSIITGSCEAHRHKDCHLPLELYLRSSKNIFYGVLEKTTIFQIYLHYKEWKKKSSHYDFMDMCNHILCQLYKVGDEYSEERIKEIFGTVEERPEFNYLFLDEVQDLPPAVIYLISLVFGNGVYYSGDTAQAIHKGVSFKFSDITNMYRESFPIQRLHHEPPTHFNLTVNFRSHNQILELANNIVKVIQSIFPSTIDSMKKESAKANGPKPILLNRESQHHGNEEIIRQLLIHPQIKVFSCNQAFIVRSDESKNKLSEELTDMKGLVLSGEECKGLEFDDVVVINFFNPSLEKKWRILKYIDLYPQRGNTGFDLSEINIADYEELITELKMFYTIVTRARCTLLIYDPNIPEQFLHIWQAHSLVEKNIYDPSRIEAIKDDIQLYKKEVLQNTGDSWQKKGFAFYMNKKYELALQCYSRLEGMEDVCMKIRAIMKQEKWEEKLHHLQQRYDIPPYFFEIEEDQIPKNSHWKQFIIACNKDVFQELKEAAQMFCEIELFENAGDCFYECGECENALKMYYKCLERNLKQIGLCHQRLKQYQQAADCFFSCGDFTRMMFCLQRLNNYEVCYEYMQKCPGYEHQEYFFRKFSILIINRQYGKIDKQLAQDQIFLPTSPPFTSFALLSDFTKCQTLFEVTNRDLAYLRTDKLLKFRKYALEKSILTDVLNIFMEKQDAERCLQAINHHKFQGELALGILFERFEKEKAEFYQKIQNHQPTQQNNELVKMQPEMSNLESQTTKKYQKISKCLQSLKEHQTFQQQRLKKASSKMISGASEQLLTELTQIIQQITSIKLFLPENSKFYFDVLYCHPRQTIFAKTARQETTLIIEEMQRKLSSISEQIKLHLNTPIIALNQIKVKKKKLSSYEYFDSIAGEDEKILTKKKYLPAVPFVEQIAQVVEELQFLLKRYFSHALEQERDQVRLDFCFRIYNGVLERNDPRKIFPLRSLSAMNNTLEKEEVKLKEIKEKFFNNKNISTVQKRLEFKTLEQRRHSKELQKGFMHHRYLAHIGVQTALELGRVKKEELQIFNKLELIAPRTYLAVAVNLGLKQLVVEAFIWCLSVKSVNYVNKSSFHSEVKIKPKDAGTLINLLNPLYFDFPISRTKYRREIAANDLLQAAILLGFCDEVASKLSPEREINLKYVFMKEENIKKQIKKVRQSFSGFGEEILSQMQGLRIMSLFRQLDQCHEDAWMSRKIEKEIQLDEGQIQQVTKCCDQGKKSRNQRVLLLENEQKLKIMAKGSNLLGDYQKIKTEIAEDELRKEFKFPNKFLRLICKGEESIYPFTFGQILKAAVSHMENLTSNAKNWKYRSPLLLEADELNRQVEKRKKDHFFLLNKLKEKIKRVIQNMEIDWIFKDIDLLYQFNLDQKYLSENLYNILNYLWQNNIIRSEKKAQEFEDLFQQIIDNKKWISNNVEENQKCQKTILNFVEKIGIKLKEVALVFKEYQNLFVSVDSLKKELIYYEHDYVRVEQRRLMFEKKQNTYRQMRIAKAKQLGVELSLLPKCLRMIFFYEEVEDNISFFEETVKHLSRASPQQITTVLLIYLAHQKYTVLKKHIQQHFSANMEQRYLQTCYDITDKLRNCFDNRENLSLLASLLELFKCRLVNEQPNMRLLKYFVLVSHESPILNLLKEKPKTFCYFVDQKRETLLMKVSDVLQELERQTKIGLPWSADESIEATLWLSSGYEKMRPDRYSQFIQKIQHSRVRLFEFLWKNQFISHQSSLFVYHQLKCYSDLICLMLEGEMNPSLEKVIASDLRELEAEFESWEPYASKFQFVFKRR